MRFFFDRCFPVRIARVIHAFERGHTVRHLDDDERFEPTTPDTEWITALGQYDPAWIIVSVDRGILRNKAERAALVNAGLKFYYLTRQWAKLSFHEQAWRFLKVWPDIVESASHEKGRVFEVTVGKNMRVFRIE